MDSASINPGMVVLIVAVVVIGLVVVGRVRNSDPPTQEDFFAKNSRLQSVPADVRIIFWTGGFDSSYLILSALLIDGAEVQPVYVSDMIDNESYGKKTRRFNTEYERRSMALIRAALESKHPLVAQRLRTTVDIVRVRVGQRVQRAMQTLFERKLTRRPVCQYGALAQIANYYNRPIELAIENAPKSTGMARSVRNRLVELGSLNCRVDPGLFDREPEFSVYRNFRYTIAHLQKHEMHAISVEHKFDDMLRLTWSCWYPRPDGSPCGRCIMCHGRII